MLGKVLYGSDGSCVCTYILYCFITNNAKAALFKSTVRRKFVYLIPTKTVATQRKVKVRLKPWTLIFSETRSEERRAIHVYFFITCQSCHLKRQAILAFLIYIIRSEASSTAKYFLLILNVNDNVKCNLNALARRRLAWRKKTRKCRRRWAPIGSLLFCFPS